MVIAGAFGVGEMLTADGFFLAPFAIAAAVAAVADAAGGDRWPRWSRSWSCRC